MDAEMRFDRSVSEELIGALQDGPASQLVDLARDQPVDAPLYDLQLRRDPKGGNPRSWATLYYGMTALINLEQRGDLFRLTADKSYRSSEAFQDSGHDWQPRSSIEAEWPRVAAYLDEIKRRVASSHISKEGPVHAAISSGASDAYRVINREARPSFRDTPTRSRRLAAWVKPFNQALAERQEPPRWWPREVKVGSSLDFLAVDIGGRLAIVEAKAASASAAELAKVAIQVGVYASMFADLLKEDPEAVPAISRMLQHRTLLGLSRPGVLHLRDERRVVPVIAIGPNAPSQEVRRRMWEVAGAVADKGGANVDPIEVWYLDTAGRISEVERAEDVRARDAQ